VEVLRKSWPTVAHKTGLTESELTHAEALGEQLARGVALQNAPIEELKQLAELRDRAFTVFVRAYGQVRHALQYLRRERNDAERYAPSLYGHRRSRKAKAIAAAVTQNTDTQSAVVEQGASAQSAAIAPSANAPLPVERVPEQQQACIGNSGSSYDHSSASHTGCHRKRRASRRKRARAGCSAAACTAPSIQRHNPGRRHLTNVSTRKASSRVHCPAQPQLRLH